MTARLIVEIAAKDHNRVANRIKMLDGVESVLEFKERDESVEVTPDEADFLVKCEVGTRKCDVEELLLGVRGIKIQIVE